MEMQADARTVRVDPYRLIGLISVIVSGAVTSIVLGVTIPAIGDGIMWLALVVAGAI